MTHWPTRSSPARNAPCADAIATLPNGRYENEVWSDGFEEPIRIRVAVTVEDEDIAIDFAGSSPQSRRGINVVMNYTHGYASFAIKAAHRA